MRIAGKSGARLVATAMYRPRRTGGRYALCTMCIGVEQGISLIMEVSRGNRERPREYWGNLKVEIYGETDQVVPETGRRGEGEAPPLAVQLDLQPLREFEAHGTGRPAEGVIRFLPVSLK